MDAPTLTRESCAAALGALETRTADLGGRRHAAVALAVVTRAGADPTLLLTLRPSRMRAHPGQFALPGGAVDPGETPPEAAIRELEEELGVRSAPSGVLGRLDDFVTRSGYVITPVVVWVGDLDAPLAPNPDEVALVFEVTMAELDREPRFHAIADGPEPLIQWPFRGEYLFAPTAAIMHQFREVVLRGRHTRVDGFAQPDFASR